MTITIDRIEGNYLIVELENGKIIGTVEANPSTEIYKIVEELLK